MCRISKLEIKCMAVVTKDSHVGRKINKIKKSEFHERMHLFFSQFERRTFMQRFLLACLCFAYRGLR